LTLLLAFHSWKELCLLDSLCLVNRCVTLGKRELEDLETSVLPQRRDESKKKKKTENMLILKFFFFFFFFFFDFCSFLPLAVVTLLRRDFLEELREDAAAIVLNVSLFLIQVLLRVTRFLLGNGLLHKCICNRDRKRRREEEKKKKERKRTFMINIYGMGS
jgi:hypothetical protein